MRLHEDLGIQGRHFIPLRKGRVVSKRAYHLRKVGPLLYYVFHQIKSMWAEGLGVKNRGTVKVLAGDTRTQKGVFYVWPHA